MPEPRRDPRIRGLRASFLPAAVAIALILGLGVFAERQWRGHVREDARAAVGRALEPLAAGLGKAIADEVAALRRLEGALAVAPTIDQAGFQALAASFAGGAPPKRAMAALSRDGQLVQFPAAGPAGQLARLLAAPGGSEAGTRLVFAPAGPALVLWAATPGGGHVGVATDAEALFAAAGLRAPGLALDVAVTGAAAEGHSETRPLYLGDAAVLAGDPVRRPVAVAGDTWTLAAVPRDGWGPGAAAAWPLGLATLLAAGLIVGPMLRAWRLTGERRRNLGALHDREVELERLSRRLGLALDASRVGVWDFNIDTDALVWDARMDELYAQPADGQPRCYRNWRGRLHPADLARAEAEFRDAIEVTGRYNSDYRLVLPDGTLRHIRAIGAVYRDEDGTRIVGVNWDVTADVARRAELEAKRLEAEAASIVKSQFLATMSHEIRTPMNGVIGMLDLLLRTRLDVPQRQRAQVARDSACHLLAILNDILDFSKLEAHGVTLERTAVDPRALARAVVALMEPGAEARGIVLGAEIERGVPDWVVGDPTRLRQVLMNLVGNAVKFTDAGRVELGLRYDAGDGVLRVAVRDTGIGIPDAAKGQLFRRFAQVDASTTRERGGTGLGLAISRQLVELMGGEIGVDSVAGLGSTFRFWIPAPPAPAPDAAPGTPAVAVPERLAPLRVLVAEDNPTNQHVLTAYLAMAGHAVRVVGNGLEAVEAMAKSDFDLVILDIQMPVMDGLAAARRIRALDGPAAGVPILALTANALGDERERYRSAGMDDYVAKPIAADALDAAIARAVAARRPAPRARSVRSAAGTDA